MWPFHVRYLKNNTLPINLIELTILFRYHLRMMMLLDYTSTVSRRLWQITYTFFAYKQRFFSTQPQCCLTFSWIQLQMLPRYCLIHISIIILRHFVFTMFTIFTTFTPRLDLCLFMSVLCDLFLIFIFIFILVHRIITWQTCSFAYFLEYVLLCLDNNVDEECEKFLISKCSVWG